MKKNSFIVKKQIKKTQYILQYKTNKQYNTNKSKTKSKYSYQVKQKKYKVKLS